MIVLHVIMDLEGAWPELEAKLRDGSAVWLGAPEEEGGRTGDMTVGGLPRGMTSGNPSVAIRIDLPDGRVVVAETSLRLFLAAAAALRARYGEL